MVELGAQQIVEPGDRLSIMLQVRNVRLKSYILPEQFGLHQCSVCSALLK